MNHFESWGRYPKSTPTAVQSVNWQHESINFDTPNQTYLPYAHGRSYGDSCLNNDGTLLNVSPLRRIIAFNQDTGIFRCEAGVTFADILQLIVPKGWFLPVTPGTKHVSVGGAIANDVHGKNHHRAGTFGCHLRAFEILRSAGKPLTCSNVQNAELFSATIGGLGLTGVILWAEFQLMPILGPWMETKRTRFNHLNDFFVLSKQADEASEYTVAWIDCFANRKNQGRGIFIQGNHQREGIPSPSSVKSRRSIGIPFNSPSFLLNPYSLRLFNALHYRMASRLPSNGMEFFDTFFYPLDFLNNWNRLYGSPGFLQYQCLIPPPYQETGISDLLTQIRRSGQGSFLAVLKQFGSKPSPGLLSFPRQGTTLALDFPNRGEKTLNLLRTLDDIVCECGGSVYPAKDARMSPEHFNYYYPNWKTFQPFIDPKFSSSFWRRVTNTTVDTNTHKAIHEARPSRVR